MTVNTTKFTSPANGKPIKLNIVTNGLLFESILFQGITDMMTNKPPT